MTVFIDSPLVDAGDIPPPEVGAVITLPLAFIEDTLPTGSDRDVTTVRAGLDLSDDPPRLRGGRMGVERHWQWTGVLRGDGWTAQWAGMRPRTGQVELTGRFSARPWARERVRGRVTRVTLVSTPYTRAVSGAWTPAPDAAPRYVDVDSTPRWLNLEADPHDRVIGVLVDLDLYDVPRRELRPPLVPGDVSASGSKVWILDQQLPVVVCIDADQIATEYVLPGAPRAGRQVHATPRGCWISGPDGLYRVTIGRAAHQVSDAATTVATTLGETALARSLTQPWTLNTPGAAPIRLDLPEGLVAAAAASDDSFLIAIHSPDQDALRFFRVAPAGAVMPGPIVAPNPARNGTTPVLAGSPLRLVLDPAAPGIGTSSIPAVRLPTSPVRVGTARQCVWLVTHPRPSDTAPATSTQPHAAARQSWLLTVLDDTTFTPILSSPIPTPSPAVARDDRGTFWLVHHNQLATLTPNSTQGGLTPCPLPVVSKTFLPKAPPRAETSPP